MKKRIGAMVLLLVIYGIEAFLAHQFYSVIVPFPEDEYWFTVVNNCLRDLLLLGIAGLLYLRRKRVPDRMRRYFPVVVIGFIYLVMAVFMVQQLSLDRGFLTSLAILTGLNNNVLIVLLAAMCYHKWPGWQLKACYFMVYFLSLLTMIFDGFYFWQTSMHVQSVLFKNFNIYAIQGVLSGMTTIQILGIVVTVIVGILLFRVSKPQKHKPNFAWSLLCVAVFSIVLNLSYRVSGNFNEYFLNEYLSLWAEVESEVTRNEYRNLLIIPMNVNFANKMLFDSDKIVRRQQIEQRLLTNQDKRVLCELGILRDEEIFTKAQQSYDRIVLLILESVHRDYINYYNANVPEAATPFLNSILSKYPRIDNYYSSAIPTTQGLNATFRSQLIYDGDLPGDKQPSLFRSAQAAGWRGIFLNASSQYYSNEIQEYPAQFGMKEYYAKEYLQDLGYSGASGWGYHNDVMYQQTLCFLEKARNEKMLLVTKTLDMHQPYPYYGICWADQPETVRDHCLVTIRGMQWVDKTLENFFKAVEQKGLFDDKTLFVITSDHNPHSGGEYTQIVTEEKDRKSIAPIPLIFISKNLVPLDNLRTRDFASQIDLAPTLLHLLGIQAPKEFMGRNLLKPVSKPYALGYFGGKAYYYSEEMVIEDQMDNPMPDNEYEDSLTNYVIHEYGKQQMTAESAVRTN